jgi:hypothetical protein
MRKTTTMIVRIALISIVMMIMRWAYYPNPLDRIRSDTTQVAITEATIFLPRGKPIVLTDTNTLSYLQTRIQGASLDAHDGGSVFEVLMRFSDNSKVECYWSMNFNRLSITVDIFEKFSGDPTTYVLLLENPIPQSLADAVAELRKQ